MADTGHRDHHSDRCARASPQGGVAGSDKDYAYANDDNDHEDDHEDDHGEDEYELSDEQAAEARGALLADIFASSPPTPTSAKATAATGGATAATSG